MFEDWWRKHLTEADDLNVMRTVRLAYANGRIDGERGMSGAVAESAKDCRRAGFHEAADLIEAKTIPETLAIEKSNADGYIKSAQGPEK